MGKIETLEREVDLLKSRVAELERLAGPGTGKKRGVIEQKLETGSPAEGSSTAAAPPVKPERAKKHIFTQDGLESAIGGRLLNRVGIVVLLLATAYFLKYSFDNHWINEPGRIIIGMIAGIALILSGDLTMKRKYFYFSQGLSGGGIGVMYLTTYAAVNFYHIFSPPVAFGLLILTASAGGLLSVRQNAFGVAILSTIGGFMSPFLIGSREAQPLILFSYIAILNIGVLYLAYHKYWHSLNLLSFFGTASVLAAFKSVHYSGDLLVIQVFLTVYFLIFGTLAFIYNVRHGKPTRAIDLLLLVLNAFFFLGASLINLDRYHDWHGPFAVVLAVIYLAVGMVLSKRKLGDNRLFLALLGTGLSFVTVAIPLQLHGHWRTVAWLVEAAALVYGGVTGRSAWIHRAGLILLTAVSLGNLDMNYYYRFIKPAPPLLNYYSLTSFLSIAGFFFVFYLFYRRHGHIDRAKIMWPAAVAATLLTLKQFSWEAVTAVRYFKLGYQSGFAVSVLWVILAVILMAAGMTKDIKGFRYISLAVFGVTILKVLLFDLTSLAVIFRVLILLIVGVIFVGVSFMYQRRERKMEE